jgi:ubiquinone/menaquinone biosynthesis C-methylase UbiE
MSHEDQVRARFAATAERLARHAAARADELAARVRSFAEPRGDERALDAGTGTGALAFALAPLVGEVVAVELVPELLAEARRHGAAYENVSFLEADMTRLPFEVASFDLTATLRTLHHLPRPELAVAELARVTRAGGHVLVIDQIGPIDPLAAIELDRFERTRDPSHTRLLPDGDMRALFEANRLVLLRARFEREPRELDRYLDLAGCAGEAREQARRLAPADPYTAEVAWYLLRRA